MGANLFAFGGQLVEDMAIKAADGMSDGQIAVTEDELRELNNTVSAL